MFSAELLDPHQNLHAAIHTDTARKSQEAMQVGIQLFNWHQGWKGTKRVYCYREITPTKQTFCNLGIEAFPIALHLLTMPSSQIVQYLWVLSWPSVLDRSA